MKIYVLACLVGLTLYGVPGQCQEAVGGAEVSHEEIVDVKDEEIVDVDDEENIDVAHILGDLVEYEHEDEVEAESTRDDRKMTEETKYDSDVIVKYNKFIDTFLSRLSIAMRASHDPMRIVLRKSGKVTLESTVSKKDKPEKKKNSLKGRHGKPRERHPKDLNLGQKSTSEAEEEQISEKESLEETKREIVSEVEENEEEYEDYEEEDELVEGEQDGRVLDTEYDIEYDDEDEFEDDEVGLESPREGRQLEEESADEGKSAVSGRKRRRRRKGGRRRKCGRVCRKRRRRRRRRRGKGGRKKRPRGKRSTAKSTAIVSGISNIRRAGDVRIKDEKSSQYIAADFDVGPIVLKAERVLGGPSQNVKKAEAVASNVKGEVVISITQSGVAKVKKLHLIRPTAIQVSGNIARKSGKSSNQFMKSYISKAGPLIAHKMKKAASQILTTPVNDNNNNNEHDKEN